MQIVSVTMELFTRHYIRATLLLLVIWYTQSFGYVLCWYIMYLHGCDISVSSNIHVLVTCYKLAAFIIPTCTLGVSIEYFHVMSQDLACDSYWRIWYTAARTATMHNLNSLLAHSFIPCLALQSELESDATIVSAFIGALHCAFSKGKILLEKVGGFA